MADDFQLVLGTNNAKKRQELVQLIGTRPIQLLSLSDFSNIVEVEETGTTFAANAELKAAGYAQQTGHWVLAEDSGLSVHALDGEPGVYSARFSGPDATDDSNNELLLQRMANEDENRLAWYTCHIVICDPLGNVSAQAESRCYGRILRTPRGEFGFGYDPLFELPEYDLTFAQLGQHVKSILSHRGRAYRKILPSLTALASSQTLNSGASKTTAKAVAKTQPGSIA